MEAAGVIDKHEKTVSWRGIPRNLSSSINDDSNTATGQSSSNPVVVNNNMEVSLQLKRRLEIGISKKKARVSEYCSQYSLYEQLVVRNRNLVQNNQLEVESATNVHLPFVVVHCPPSTLIKVWLCLFFLCAIMGNIFSFVYFSVIEKKEIRK
jgi:hypothetical protein